MADRSILEFASTSIRPTTVASTTMQSGAALLSSVSNMAGKLRDDAVAEWSQARVAEATTAGQEAGGLPQVDYRPNDGTLTSAAFNKAAARTHLSTMQTTMQAKLNEFQNKFADNPNEYLKQSTAYIGGVVSEMNENAATKKYASQFEMQAKLQQEAQGYTISRKYQAKVIEEAKVANSDYMFGVRNDTYRTASGMFSKDATEQAYSLNQFANAKKLFSASLHQVTPDGKAVYSASEISAMEKDFHTGYYVKGVKDYISSGAASTEDMLDVLSDKSKVTLQLDSGKTADIDVFSEVGVDAYEKIKSFTKTKLREQTALKKSMTTEMEKGFALQKKTNAFKLTSSIASGEAVPLDQIDGMLERGEIDYAGAVAARTMALNPSNRDDVHAVEAINATIANGIDAYQAIASASGVISSPTIVALSKANETMQAKGRKTLYKEHLKMIKSEFGAKTMFGDFSDTNMAATFNDITLDYMNMVEEGMEPELAFEKMRDVAEGIKKADDMGKFTRFKEIVVRTDGVVDPAASFKKIKAQIASGDMDMELGFYYLDKLGNTEE